MSERETYEWDRDLCAVAEVESVLRELLAHWCSHANHVVHLISVTRIHQVNVVGYYALDQARLADFRIAKHYDIELEVFLNFFVCAISFKLLPVCLIVE